MSKSSLISAIAIIVVVIAILFMKKQSNTETGLDSTPTTTPRPIVSVSVSPSTSLRTSPSISLGASPVQTAQQTPGPVLILTGGLKIQDLVIGTGDKAQNGKTLSMHYVGTLENGTKFDSSFDRGQPFSFVIGEGEVIQGWEKGVLGMKVGGKRKLIIPPALGYGSTGAGNIIPPNATLFFEVQLLAGN